MSTATADPPVEKTAAEKVRDLQLYLEKRTKYIAAIATKAVDPAKIITIVVNAARRTPALAACSPLSIYLALLQAAELGLEPNTPLQLAALVPYNNKNTRQTEAQFQPMYRGLIRLAVQSGETRSVVGRAVYEADVFEVAYGDGETWVHKPEYRKARGALIGAYAEAVLKDGTKIRDYIPRERIEQVRARSQAAMAGPWVTDYDEMAVKTAIKHLCKYLVLSSDTFARAVHHANRADGGDAPDYTDVIDVAGEVVPETTSPPEPLALDHAPQETLPETPVREKVRAAVVERAAKVASAAAPVTEPAKG